MTTAYYKLDRVFCDIFWIPNNETGEFDVSFINVKLYRNIYLDTTDSIAIRSIMKAAYDSQREYK